MKKLISVFILLSMAAAAVAQQGLSSQEMIGITPMMPHNTQLPNDAKASLNMKLRQMALRNGFGSTSGRFVLTADVVTLDKQVMRTAPAQYIVDIAVSVYAVDVLQQTIVGESQFTLKGIDRNENRAYIKAINNLNPLSADSRRLMNLVREKITDYYTTQVPNILISAETLASMQMYSKALSVLADIPQTITEYPVVAQRMADIYRDMIDVEAQAYIREAESLIAVGKYEDAMDVICMVNPSSGYAPKADQVIASVRNQGGQLAELAEHYAQVYAGSMASVSDVPLSEQAFAYGISSSGENSLSELLADWAARNLQ